VTPWTENSDSLKRGPVVRVGKSSTQQACQQRLRENLVLLHPERVLKLRYLASGGVDPGRIYRSSNGGKDWKVSNSSITGGAAAGVFSVRFRDAKNGIAVGGNYTNPTGNINVSSWSKDGGVTWQASEGFPAGYRSGASWMPGRKDVAIAVGTSGSDITFDGGKNWRNFDNGTFDAVECIGKHTCWASGSKGRVARLTLS
jgi:hypothetical protein